MAIATNLMGNYSVDQYMNDRFRREMQYIDEQRKYNEQLKRKLEQDAPISLHKQPNLILLLEEV